MALQLTRPIVFFDLETTGLQLGKDRIVQISLVKLFPDGHRESLTSLVNPGIKIDPESIEIHHITDEMVKDAPSFRDLAPRIIEFITDCDLGGYNSNRFDIPMLAEELLVNGINYDLRQSHFVDVQNIFHKKEQRTLIAALRFYCDRDYEDKAHDAHEDTEATVDVFLAQMKRYDDLPQTVEGLADFTAIGRNVDFAGRIVYDDCGVEIVNFGKYKGRPIKEVFKIDAGYYDWIMRSDFALDTKQVLSRLKAKYMFS